MNGVDRIGREKDRQRLVGHAALHSPGPELPNGPTQQHSLAFDSIASETIPSSVADSFGCRLWSRPPQEGRRLSIPAEFETNNSQVFARLQERFKRIITPNLDALSGKHVIDLASNNGRWSYAAMEAGAASVTGIEGRASKAEEARAIFARLGKADRARFHVGDMYDWLHDRTPEPVDTVLCLGVFYHIMDHHRLMSLMARTKCQTIIIDSGFVRSFRNSVHVQLEDPSAHRNALPKFDGQAAEFAGFVSLGLMIQMAWNLGFTCRPVLWDPAEVADKPAVQDYMMGRRFTVRLERTGQHSDPDWDSHWRPALVALNPKFNLLFSREKHDEAADDRVRRPLLNTQYSIM